METLKEICKNYPEFGNNVYVRGEVRTAYFKHLAMLRQGEFSYNMKVVEMEWQHE